MRFGSLRRSNVDWMLGVQNDTVPPLVDDTWSALELALTQLRYWMFPGSDTKKFDTVEPV